MRMEIVPTPHAGIWPCNQIFPQYNHEHKGQRERHLNNKYRAHHIYKMKKAGHISILLFEMSVCNLDPGVYYVTL